MPRISKKRLNESSTSRDAIKASSLKTPTTNRNKKLKSIFNRLNSMERTQTRDKMGRTLSSSDSTDSVIYVGSYKLNEKYSLIDLTKSMDSMKSEESYQLSRYTQVPNFQMFYTNVVQHCNLPCASSTSRLLDSIEGSKSLKKNTKSASCLIVVNDKKINKRNSDFSKEIYSLNKKEKHYIDKITELGEEDQSVIKHSLEIEDDMNILELCSPQPFLTHDVPIETLMQTYRVDGADQFS